MGLITEPPTHLRGKEAAYSPSACPYMTRVMAVLSRDHKNFGNLLDVLTHVADLVVAGEEVDLNIVRAGAVYYRGYVAAFHHPVEDLLYGFLRMKVPATVERIFPVAEDHRHYASWVVRLLESVKLYEAKRTKPHGSGRSLRTATHRAAEESFCLAIREFVSHMRSHMLNERPLFQLAMKNLATEDWKAISRTIVIDDDPLFNSGRPRYERLLKAVLDADETARGRLLRKSRLKSRR